MLYCYFHNLMQLGVESITSIFQSRSKKCKQIFEASVFAYCIKKTYQSRCGQSLFFCGWGWISAIGFGRKPCWLHSNHKRKNCKTKRKRTAKSSKMFKLLWTLLFKLKQQRTSINALINTKSWPGCYLKLFDNKYLCVSMCGQVN